MAKVFVVNKGCHNYDDAKRFGELSFLSEGIINRYATGTMYRTFWPKLSTSSSDDHILITGLSVMTGIACGIFASLHGRLNLLIYKVSRKGGEGSYISRTVLIDDKEGGE